MRFGTFHLLTHPPGLTAQDLLQQTLNEAVLAEELGFDTCWLTEHHGSRYGLSSNPAVLAAAIAARTQRIRLGFAAHITPMHHPVRLAEQVAMVDQLSGGRVIAGFGAGYSPYEFSMVGADFETRHGTHWEIVDLVRELWTQPQVTHRGELFDLEGAASFPKPLQQPHPPMAISAMSPFSSSVRYAAEMEFIPISANFIGNWSVKSHWQVYAEEAEKHGRTADPEIWRVAKNIHIADTDAEAEAFVKQPGGSFDWYFDYLYRIFDRAQMKGAFVVNKGDDASELTHDMLRDNYTLYGSPETVAEKILALREDIGHFGTLVLTAQDWVDADAMKRSMTLLAEEVMPKVNAASGSQAAAD